MLVPVFAATLLSLTYSCQNIRLIAEDGSVVIGRSLEFSEVPVEASNYLVTEPAGTEHKMPLTENCVEPFVFKSDFKVVRFKVWFGDTWANTTLGGLNSKGLSASTLYFTDYAKFKDPAIFTGDMCNNIIPQTKLATYVLGKYSTVKQIKKDLKKKVFPKVWNQADLGMDTIPVHFVFHDSMGHSLVLEYTKKGMQYHDNTVGAMTNSPDFEWHMTNLRNYPTLQREEFDGFKWRHLGKKYVADPQWVGTGFSGLPGDYSSPSRFIKAATMVANSGKIKDSEQAVTRMFHMMNAADIPKGIMSAGKVLGSDGKKHEHVDYTWWISVYDLSGRCVYYRGYVDLSVKRVCLDKIPKFAAKVNVDGDFADGFTDTTEDLTIMIQPKMF